MTQEAEATKHEAGRLSARPRPPQGDVVPHPLPPGLHPLDQGGARGGLLRVPDNPALAGAALPLIVMLHGATGDAERALRRLLPIADAALIALPESMGRSWDVMEGGYGPDVARLDAALARLFAAWPVDPARIAIAGFSDGASYAASLALMNGDLFRHALVFSPGFAAPNALVGKARFFVSHGVLDEVLSIDHGSRRLVRKLLQGGWTVRYVEFDGGHTLPEPVVREALDFFLAAPEATGGEGHTP
jgi:dipeptidyl aminopeptidase/acylaminoacyl peptidase